MNNTFYSANIAFLYHDEELGHMCERGHNIIYPSQNNEQAVRDAWRWIRNRQEACPEFFGRCGAVKIGFRKFPPIQPDGYQESGNSFPFYEWKCDAGVSRGPQLNVEVQPGVAK